MNGNKHAMVTTLPDPDDAPELTDEFFKRASQHHGDTLVRRGRPPATVHKAPVTLRLDPEALARWRSSGKGWQTRAAAILAEKAPK